MPKKIEYRPGALSEAIATRTGETGSHNHIARTMAERYVELCRRSLPHLETSEWYVVLEACQGHVPTSLDDWLLNADELIRINGAAKRHGVPDADALLGKLRAMTFAEAVACLDWAEAHWAAVGRGEKPLVPGEIPHEVLEL